MHQYNFKLDTGDKNAGTVYLPSQQCGKLPVLIYCHGWGGNCSLPSVINCLLEKEIAIVAFDFYGGGDTGGDYTHMTYKRWEENLSDILTWVSEQPFADCKHIGCYAFSSGSTAALRLAAEDERIKFIVSVGTCISAHIFMKTGGPAKWLADNLHLLVSGGSYKDFGLDFFVDTISNAPIHTVNNIKCPALLLQGTADNPYRCADAKMAYDLMRFENSPVTHIEIENGNHGLDNVADKAGSILLNWLAEIDVLEL